MNVNCKFFILIGFIFIFGCSSIKYTKDFVHENIPFYPIGENELWGFADSSGETVIEPKFDYIEFFSSDLALVRIAGKYGYINRSGKFHIRPKFSMAHSFIYGCASVTKDKESFFINKNGRKIDSDNCNYSIDGGGCRVSTPANPEKYFLQVNDKYELPYTFHIKTDSANYLFLRDTTNMELDSIQEFGTQHILVKKNNKYGLFYIWPPRIIINKKETTKYRYAARKEASKLIEFKYDKIYFENYNNNAISFAKVRIGEKWGIINDSGYEVIEVAYTNIINFGGRIALVEYEPNKFGYKRFYSGEEYFKRSQ